MFTTGTKLLIGATALAIVGAIVYGVTQDGAMGTIGLVSAACALAFLAGVNLYTRDSNVDAADASAVATAPAGRPAPGSSVWPLGFAFGGVVIAVGLISYQTIVVIGLVVVLATGAEWMLQAWAERASGDPDLNSAARDRLAAPLELPIGGAAAIGIVVFAFSRIMLWLSKTNTVVAFSVMAAVVLAVGFLFAFRPSIKTGAMGGVAVVAGVAIVATGSAAGLDGERDIRTFETTGLWMEEALLHPTEYAEGAAAGDHPAELICESPEEFPEADEKASQTVAMKANTVSITLLDDGTLDYDVPGPLEVGGDALVLPRSNATNILFRNDHDDEARLSVFYGTELREVEGTETETPRMACTSLVEEGGAQLLTVIFPEPSIASPDGFRFFVPGVESATLELVVP
jgi:hypothetical protein